MDGAPPAATTGTGMAGTGARRPATSGAGAAAVSSSSSCSIMSPPWALAAPLARRLAGSSSVAAEPADSRMPSSAASIGVAPLAASMAIDVPGALGDAPAPSCCCCPAYGKDADDPDTAREALAEGTGGGVASICARVPIVVTPVAGAASIVMPGSGAVLLVSCACPVSIRMDVSSGAAAASRAADTAPRPGAAADDDDEDEEDVRDSAEGDIRAAAVTGMVVGTAAAAAAPLAGREPAATASAAPAVVGLISGMPPLPKAADEPSADAAPAADLAAAAAAPERAALAVGKCPWAPRSSSSLPSASLLPVVLRLNDVGTAACSSGRNSGGGWRHVLGEPGIDTGTAAPAGVARAAGARWPPCCAVIASGPVRSALW